MLDDIFVILPVLELVGAVFIMFFTLGLLFGITMPFVGTLIRYRANYTPKAGAVRLDGEDGLGGTPSSEKAPSYFGMMKRVYRIEGWAGLYKGLMPSIIATLILTVALVPFSVLLSAGYKVHPHGRVSLPAQSGVAMWLLSFALSTIPVLILVPMLIIINRAITTPHKLAAFDARAALRVVLSPAERAQPLRLYLAPGVALAFVLEALVGPTVSLLRYLAAPRLPLGAALGAAVPVLLLTTALVTPLQVMQARLTLQRRGPEAPDADIPLASGEAVMDFRTQEEPYTGLIDCARKMVHEEGWGVLTRAWWLTALTMLLPLLTAPKAGESVIPLWLGIKLVGVYIFDGYNLPPSWYGVYKLL